MTKMNGGALSFLLLPAAKFLLFFHWPLLLLLLLLFGFFPCLILGAEDFELRNGIRLPLGYNKVVAPTNTKNIVTIGFEIHDIPQVSDMQYTVRLSMSIYCKWNNSR